MPQKFKPDSKRRVLVVTGSRSEFGLLTPVMKAIAKHPRLMLQVVVAGEHLLAPAKTVNEVAAAFRIDARVPMQKGTDRGRLAHAAACARGMAGFARAFKRLKPDWVVVLGDRIEAFAAASAASIAGIAVCHIHGGDRAEGIADEAMRHAITKLAHLHCAATKQSAKRIIAMGESKKHVHVTGSPAIDGLNAIKPMSDREAELLGDPLAVVLLHPSGLSRDEEGTLATLAMVVASYVQPPTQKLPNRPMQYWPILCLAPNHDAGRKNIESELRKWQRRGLAKIVDHLPRSYFVGLLKHLALRRSGLLIGNSSAGLIECAAIGLRAINIGPRQAGRETDDNVVHLPDMNPAHLRRVFSILDKSSEQPKPSMLYGTGRAGITIATLLATTDPRDPAILRKRNAY